MQYNIHMGFHNTNFCFEKERMITVQKIVKKEDPDILILNEASFGIKNKLGIFVDYKKMFNLPYFAYAFSKYSGIGNGIAIFSKYQIESSKNFTERKFLFLRIIIKVNKEKINLDVFHPHPSRTEKEKEDFLKKHLRKNKKDYILAGDFNSISPEDKYNPNKLIKVFSKINLKNFIIDALKMKTIKYLLKSNMIDTFKIKNKRFDYTIPTDYLSKNKSSAIRIDYIFCSRDFEIVSSNIIKNKLTNKASDHYPVVSVLELK
jgi:endonuclease/exonuclease/phosphatase family metal-dependent hydrolase